MKNISKEKIDTVVEKIVTTIEQDMEKYGYTMSDTLYNAMLKDMSDCIVESQLCEDEDLSEYVQEYYFYLSKSISRIDFSQIINSA